MLKKLLNKQNIILCISVLIFLVFTLYLAFNLKMGVSSDSWYHLRVSQEYSKTLTIPSNTPDTYQWRDITNIPYLYFWINGRILNANDSLFYFNPVILLRIVNILYSLFTVIGVYLLSKELIKGKYFRLVPVILLCSTLMFLFLSSSINYDNLGNMFAVYAIYFFIKTVKNRGLIQYPLLTILMLCLGSLVKYTILPLAAVLVILLIYEIIKNFNIWKESIKGQTLLWIIPVLIFGGLNLALYGNNILKYHELVPSCEKILTHEQCLENGVYLRDNVWIPAVDIKLPDMILNGERLDPVRFAGVWIWEMAKRTVGIMGDQSLYHDNFVVGAFVSLLSVSIFFSIKNWKKYKIEEKYIAVITFLYLLILMIFQNYNMYLERGHATLALQGRYMFPVISSFYVFLTITWLNIENRNIKVFLILTTVILMILFCIPFFILNVDPNWFGSIVQ